MFVPLSLRANPYYNVSLIDSCWTHVLIVLSRYQVLLVTTQSLIGRVRVGHY